MTVDTEIQPSPAFQVMPDLSEDDYEALKADIAARGVMVPVEYDERGNVLDGHHRLRACRELGITKWPAVARTGLSDEQKRQHARQLNLARRHLDRAQKRELIAGQLKDTPDASNRQIAAALGVNHETVQAVRAEAEGRGEIRHVSTRTDRAGRQQPARKPKPLATDAPTIATESDYLSAELEAELQREAASLAEEERAELLVQAGERIALAGADGLVEDIERLTTINKALQARVNALNEENTTLKRQVKWWKEQATQLGWKPANG